MTKYNARQQHQAARRILSTASAAALAAAFALSPTQSAHAEKITVPRVPAKIKVPEGNTPFFEGHAVGTQNYVCLPSATGFKFVLFTPEATLFNDDDKQLTTHFFSPNPDEGGTIRATWEHSRDTSMVWAQVVLQDDASTDPDFVAPGAVAWLKLTVKGARSGPDGGDTLTRTTFIHRVNTSGGAAPLSGCTTAADVGNQAFERYTADYIFYTDR